ncbi:MAG: tRNA (guanosine(46)-N7)-methyltransferase TrmB [Flavobacteriaceae bacterium TMED171]|nr:tRNA (guanosine(46)-N7)-methyltransferase TrmB [Flavobacteriaceae bacterium]OUW31945.1 MAG: tRNA (guanosine(46)-N7)-methyltransferase TrmB [Flavobacteriaceae bacterium TMED171]|tara:strand:- start:550 stop:1224 length:675 start_codon:yes stop_codon:yes gene_type:complete
MGSKNKLKRFKENETFKNVIQPEREMLENDVFQLKGNWHTDFFKNDNPIVLELGCGKGEYTLYLATQNSDKNFIGIDIKGARFWRGAKTALEKNLQNIAFIRAQIELIDTLFSIGEVAEIWITFPDPQIKFKRTKHRLTHPEFFHKYKQILQPGGSVHLKTDSEFLHGYTLGILNDSAFELLYAHHDIYNNPHAPEVAIGVQTFYEKIFLEQNKPITYLELKFK